MSSRVCLSFIVLHIIECGVDSFKIKEYEVCSLYCDSCIYYRKLIDTYCIILQIQRKYEDELQKAAIEHSVMDSFSDNPVVDGFIT